MWIRRFSEGAARVVLAVVILPGASHFASEQRIAWHAEGCSGRAEATLQRWQGDWLSANGLWLEPPEFKGRLEKLVRMPMKPGAYKLKLQGEGCSGQKEFTVAPFYVVARWDRNRLLMSGYRFRDEQPIQGLQFSVRNGNQTVTLGWTGPTDTFVMDTPSEGSEIRVTGPGGEPAALPWARSADSATTRNLRVFASRDGNGLHLLFVSPVSRRVLLKNSMGDIFWRVGVEAPFTTVTLSGFRGTSVWVVDEEPSAGTTEKVSAGYPPWVWLPSEKGVPGIAAERAPGEAGITLGWKTAGGTGATVSYSLGDESERRHLPTLEGFPADLAELAELWAEGRGGRMYYRWTEDPREALAGTSLSPGPGRVFLMTPEEARPSDMNEIAAGTIRTNPPGAWVLVESLSDGALWVERRFLPAHSLEPWNMPRFLDPIIGGSCVRLQIADIGPVAVIITDPEFSAEGLAETHPVNVTSSQPVFVSHSPRFLGAVGAAAVFVISEDVGPGVFRVCLPASPGVYRLTTLARKSGSLLSRSLTFTVEEGIAHDYQIEEIPDTPYSYRLTARFVNASRSIQNVMIRTDLPIGLALQPGEVREFQRDFAGRQGDRIIAIVKERDALLLDESLGVKAGWEDTFPGVILRVMRSEGEAGVAVALAHLYEFGVEDGFGLDREATSPDVEATAVAYLAMKTVVARGGVVDPRRFNLAQKRLAENAVGLPDWLRPGTEEPLPEPLPRFPETCSVFPEDIVRWKGAAGTDECPARALGFTATLKREAEAAQVQVQSRYPHLLSDHLLVFVETGHCESPGWLLTGAAATGVPTPQSLRILADSRSAERLDLRVSCERGVVGKVIVWAPLEGGIIL
jgi:hypothetical protein